MIAVVEIFENLNDLEATIADYRRNSSTLDSMSSRLALKSLELRRDELRLALDFACEKSLVDVCDYRIVPTREGKYPIKHVGETISRFQDAVTSFFASIKERKPRANATSNINFINSSTLNYGFSYGGSLGIVMYAFNEELLASGSLLDEAVHEVLSMADDTDLREVREKADRFGKAAIKSFYTWSKSVTDSGMSLDIKWKRGAEVKERALVQPERLGVVQDIIMMAGDTRETPEIVDGILVAINLTGKGYFKLAFADEGQQEISGTLDAAFGRHETHEIPHRYKATLVRSVRASLFTDDDQGTWRLVSLE